MKRKRFTDEQITHALRQAEGGTSVAEVFRKMPISDPTFYRWKEKFKVLWIAQVRQLKLLEDENR